MKKDTKGLVHAEFMTAMTLGSPIVSSRRVLVREIAVFMQWEDEEGLQIFLRNDAFGQSLQKGWHVRMKFLRRWGVYESIKTESIDKKLGDNQPVVALTIARMKPWAVPRFIRWGRPVEKLVRDHPGTTLALASVKFPNTVSTFSIWNNIQEMTDMVHGHSQVDKPKRHAHAMQERNRKDFHFEFTTLRFKPFAEYGSWKGQSDLTQALKSTE